LLGLELEFSERRASAAALVFGLASPAAPYAKYDFAEPLGSLFLTLAVLFLMRARRRSPTNLLVAGLVLGCAILTRPEILIMSTPVLVLATFLLRGNSQQVGRSLSNRMMNVLSFSLPVLAFVALNQCINYLKFGSWLSAGYSPTAEMTFYLPSVIKALVGDLVSPGRGIFVFFPLSIMAVVGIAALFQRDRWLSGLFTGLIAAALLLYATWKDWGGGLSWGPRFLIVLVPCLTLLAFTSYDSLKQCLGRYGVLLFGVLVFLGLLASFQGLAFNFLAFYGDLHIPQSVIDRGEYSFLPENSPILMGWGGIANISIYDMFWLQKNGVNPGRNLLRSAGWVDPSRYGSHLVDRMAPFFRQAKDRVYAERVMSPRVSLTVVHYFSLMECS
jgi:hypothetical protein